MSGKFFPRKHGIHNNGHNSQGTAWGHPKAFDLGLGLGLGLGIGLVRVRVTRVRVRVAVTVTATVGVRFTAPPTTTHHLYFCPSRSIAIKFYRESEPHIFLGIRFV